jgi:hypothetical protein
MTNRLAILRSSRCSSLVMLKLHGRLGASLALSLQPVQVCAETAEDASRYLSSMAHRLAILRRRCAHCFCGIYVDIGKSPVTNITHPLTKHAVCATKTLMTKIFTRTNGIIKQTAARDTGLSKVLCVYSRRVSDEMFFLANLRQPLRLRPSFLGVAKIPTYARTAARFCSPLLIPAYARTAARLCRFSARLNINVLPHGCRSLDRLLDTRVLTHGCTSLQRSSDTNVLPHGSTSL